MAAEEAETQQLIEDITATVNINVGGTRFSLLQRTVEKIPTSRLARFFKLSHKERLQMCDHFLPQPAEYYFERSPLYFDLILAAYRAGEIHFPEYICAEGFWKEVQFWGISSAYLAPCCAHKITDCNTAILTQNDISTSTPLTESTFASPVPDTTAPLAESEDFQSPRNNATAATLLPTEDSAGQENSPFKQTRCGNLREKAWDILEQPASSPSAMVFMMISLLWILFAVAILVVGSLPEFQVKDEYNNTSVMVELEYSDAICVVWFTVEYLFRLWSAPLTCAYVRSPLSIIDLMAILPFYVELICSMQGYYSKTLEEVRRSMLLMRLLRIPRVMRVLRVLKVARYSRGFQSMGATLARSWRELLLLMLFMLTANIIFSTAMYFVEESDPRKMFDSIPGAAWWCVITMTTVGYGDVYPVTVAGKFVACLTSISGIILLAFPISIIVENFNQVYYETYNKSGADTQDGRSTNEAAIMGSAPMHQLEVQNIDGKLYVQWPTSPPRKRQAKRAKF